MTTTIKQASPFARNHLLRDAISKAIYDSMKEDSSIYLFGEGCEVKQFYDAPYILSEFSNRATTMPIAEDGGINFCVGASLLGVKPIFDVISADFLYRAMDGIANTAAKLNFVRPNETPKTIVIRAEFLTGGPSTGQRPEALFAHIPGLNVIVPSTPRDAYGLMLTALKTPGVTLFFEDREIPDDSFDETDSVLGEAIPFGRLAVRWLKMPTLTSGDRKIPNATVVTYGLSRYRVERLVNEWMAGWDGDHLEEPNLEIDLLDLRSIYPVDWDGLKHGRYGLARTGHLLIIEPDIQHGGVGAEIAATIAE